MDMKKLLLICDDAGHASVDRGIRAIADATGLPLCAEYLILTPGAIERAKEMSAHPLVSIGMHFELAGVSDAERVAMANELKTHGAVLGELAEIREKAMVDAATQLALFRDAIGRDPAHVSTHGDFNVDASGEVMQWWTSLMDGLFDGNVPPMQWANPHVRHNKYSWNVDATKREPCSPEEFETILRGQTSDVVEFVMHPALPEPDDASIDMLFTSDMRVADVEAAIAILTSGCVENAGYRVVPVSDVR
jgi:predicted glycoside hydrolase/deacetylase ChbG (UPF0249 family)